MRVRVPNLLATAEEQTVSVHPAHGEKTRRYFGRVRRGARAFTGSILLGLAATAIFLLYFWLPGLCAVLAYYGVILLLFPFSTKATLELLGVRNSVRLARVTGVSFIVGGAALLYLV